MKIYEIRYKKSGISYIAIAIVKSWGTATKIVNADSIDFISELGNATEKHNIEQIISDHML